MNHPDRGGGPGAGRLASALETRLPLAFGVSGPLATPFISAQRVHTLVQEAAACGVSCFDTAPAYGAGRAERRLGEAIAGLPTAPFIMTKAGITTTRSRRRARDFSPAGLEASVAASLARLDVARIDLLWLHGPALGELTAELASCLETLRARGQVGFFGLASRSPGLPELAARGPFDAVMCPVHCAIEADRRAELADLRARGLVVFAIEALTPAHLPSRAIYRPGVAWRTARRLAGRAPAPSKEARVSSVEDCLAWSLGPGGADLIVSTTTRGRHLRANAETIAKTLESASRHR